MQSKAIKQAIFSTLFGSFVLFFLLIPQVGHAALPAGFEVETIASGLDLPGSMVFTPDGRIFVGEKGGTVRVIKNGALLSQPLIQLTDVNAYGDRGLLSIALDPNFATNGYLYLLYTYENTPGTDFAGEKTGRLVRVTVVGDTADESTKTVILGSVPGTLATPSCEQYAVTADCIPSDSPSHSVGGMKFGTDGKLYVTLGDGAHFQYVDPRAMRAQNLDSLAGKLLRINTDGTGVSDNPFYTGNPNDNRSKVYAYGFRNAFRFDFRTSNNSLFAGDVGWGTWEEVDKVVKGGNYGWPCREGNFPTTGYDCNVTPRVDPLYVYPHDVNGAGAVVAGAFPTAYPAPYNNSFFIGDYAQDWIKIVNFDAADNFVSVQDFMTAEDGSMGPVALERGPDGNIYFISIYTGEVRRILYTVGNRQPNAVISATPTSGLAPLTVNFSAVGSSDPDGDTLSYRWNFGDGASSTAISPSHQYTANGTYTAVLTVLDGKGGQNVKSRSIAVGNQAPTAVISSPSNGSLYREGDTISLTGNGTDPEDGTITAANRLTWQIILHHNTHIHILQTLTGTNPSFPAPDHSGATDVYTEIKLTVTDAGGLTNSKSINLYLDNDLPVVGNLIQNPSLETPNPAAPNIPQAWIQGGYGIHNGVYEYPVAGLDGNNAAKVSISSYTDGDAKWFHDLVSVNPNTLYTFSGYYKSNVPLTILAQIGYGDGTYTYPTLGAALPAAANWTRIDRTFTTPANAQTAVVAIPLDRVGEITIDNFSLIQGTPPTDTTPPTVTVTAPANGATVTGTSTLTATATDAGGIVEVKFVVDGTTINTDASSPFSFVWNSASVSNGNHTVTAVARDTAGNTATATPISIQVSNTTTPPAQNRILNPSVETAGTPATIPQDWLTGQWGTNATTFTYPVTGFDGTKAVRIQTTSYTSGDAKWFFKDVPVTPGVEFKYSSYYQSNVTTSLVARYTSTSGAVSYVTIAATVPVSATWSQLNYNVVPPAGAASVTFFHLLSKVGTLTTDLYSITAPGASDTTAPVVSVTVPAGGATVTGTTTLSATATDASGIADVKFMIDSTVVNTDPSSPYSFAWNTRTVTNGSHTVRAIARDNFGNIATSSTITINVQNTVSGDTTPPTVTLTAPAAGATVSGSTDLTANATDAVGVVGVKFYVDNTLLGSEDLASPYAATLNTATLTNGNHTFFAVARDAAGNAATTTARTINVQNTTPSGPNLIGNGSFETAGTAGNPQGWLRGGWGTNTTQYVYPTVGRDGNKAARINVTAYTSGDIKWFPTDVPMEKGKVYTFSSWYKSNTISDVIGRYTLTDGSFHYFGVIKEIQPNANWTFFTTTFIPPDNAVSFTPLHLISSIGYLETDDVSLTITGTGTSTNDTTAPVVKITSPANGATVSNTINVVASSTDNIGVTYVMFAVDGTPVTGTEITTSPYTYVWNSRTVANGTHTLKATTHDAAGNNSTDTITVTVNNTATPPPDTTAPIVSVTAPTEGSTVSGTTTLSANATDESGVVDVKFMIDGTVVNTDGSSPYSFTWNSASVANGSHTVRAVARDTAGNVATSTLVTINVQNTTTPPPDTTAPTVSITAPTEGATVSNTVNITATAADAVGVVDVRFYIDGAFASTDTTATYSYAWSTGSISNGNHTLLAVARDAAGNAATSTPVTVNVQNSVSPINIIDNPSLESGGATPSSWQQGNWGNNTSVFTYPVTGFDGNKGARVAMTAHVDGDAKWYFNPETVIPEASYTFSNYYKSTTGTTLTARYTRTDGSFLYVDLDNVPAAGSWTKYEKTITIPAGITQFTVFHHIHSVGELEVDEYSLIQN